MATPGSFVAGTPLTAAEMNLLPGGCKGRAVVTASQSGITAVTDLTGATVTFTALAGRRYKITGEVLLFSNTAATNMTLAIRKGSATQIQSRPTGLIAAGDLVTATATVDDVPGAGSVTYKLSVSRQAGTGTISTSIDSTRPDLIIVEDIGV